MSTLTSDDDDELCENNLLESSVIENSLLEQCQDVSSTESSSDDEHMSQQETSLQPVSTVTAHQSGINAIDLLSHSDGKLMLSTE